MMILGLIAFCTVVMWCFPETNVARWMRASLVDQSLAVLAKLKRHHVIFLLVVLAFPFVARDFPMLWGGGGEVLALAFNLSMYLDAALVAAAVTIALGVTTVWKVVRAQLSMWLGAAAQRRWRAVGGSRTRKPREPKSLDDDDAPALGVAIAA